MADPNTNPSAESSESQQSAASADTANRKAEPNLLAFVLPLVAFMFLSGLSPELESEQPDPAAARHYMWLVIAQVLVGTTLFCCFRRVYLSHFPFRIDSWGLWAGVVGVVLWIALCAPGLESMVATSLGWESLLPERVGFDPFQHFSESAPFVTFLVFRFALLALVVPFAEEAFLRGWLVRFVEDPDWQNVRLSDIGWRGMLTATVYGVLTHPSEALAAACWFTLVSILMRRTGKFWNCVLAHAVTNLLLGVYVMIWHQWQLW